MKIKFWARHQQRWFGKWHLYLGIIAGIIVSFVGVTGSILTYRDEIDNWLNPGLLEVPLSDKAPLNIVEAYNIYKKTNPNITVNYLYKADKAPNKSYTFYEYAKQKTHFVDPYTGKELGSRGYNEGFVSVVMELHRTLLVPKIGTYIVGLASLVLIILTITGLRLWLPKKKKYIKERLTVNFKANFKRQNFDWHNVLGFYSAPVVFMLSLTGFCITFYLPIVGFVFAMAGRPLSEASNIYTYKSAYAKNIVAKTIDEIYPLSKKVFPTAVVGGVALPLDSVGNYRLDVYEPSSNKDGSRQMAVYDQYSSKMIVSSKQFPEAIHGLLSWMQSLHYGTFGGWVTRLLACIGGLIPLALTVTGVIIWWPRWQKQKPLIAKPQKKQKEEIIVGPYFLFHLKKGFKYAGITAGLAAICGALYGLLSGIILAPAVYGVVFLAPIVFVNFIVAILVNVFHLLLLPFRLYWRSLLKYLALSLAFLFVFQIIYYVLMHSGMSFF